MATMTSCDRCTTTTTKPMKWSAMKLSGPRASRSYDLCPDCVERVLLTMSELRDASVQARLSNVEIETLQRIFHTATTVDQDAE